MLIEDITGATRIAIRNGCAKTYGDGGLTSPWRISLGWGQTMIGRQASAALARAILLSARQWRYPDGLGHSSGTRIVSEARRAKHT